MAVFGRPVKDFLQILPGCHKPHPTWQDILATREEALRNRHMRCKERLCVHSSFTASSRWRLRSSSEPSWPKHHKIKLGSPLRSSSLTNITSGWMALEGLHFETRSFSANFHLLILDPRNRTSVRIYDISHRNLEKNQFKLLADSTTRLFQLLTILTNTISLP